jgi:translation initiation factor 2 beta subunit (eIF-2beta)/eIF-5
LAGTGERGWAKGRLDEGTDGRSKPGRTGGWDRAKHNTEGTPSERVVLAEARVNRDANKTVIIAFGRIIDSSSNNQEHHCMIASRSACAQEGKVEEDVEV